MESKIITFDPELKHRILKALGKTVDSEGFIVQASDETNRVLDIYGEEVKVAEFGGYKEGSELFVKSDISALIKFYEGHLRGPNVSGRLS